MRVPPPRIRAVSGLAATLLVAVASAPAHAQPDLAAEATAGSPAEDYLRALQVAGESPLYPWSLRGFSPGEVHRLVPGGAHPWAHRFAADSARPAFRVLRPELRGIYNSGFPEGGNDGAVWAGRGATAAVSAGLALRAGPFSLRLEPLAFWSQNRGFPLVPTGLEGDGRFAAPFARGQIDLPQRPGGDAVLRVDPGQSTLRLDAFGVAAGVSTADQVWGPAADLPLILGTNAGGFPHAFLGTSRPVWVGVGRVHGRVVWGSLAQSDYSPVTGHGSRRYMSGAVGVFVPRGLEGLEIGAARFFHNPWPAGGLEAGDLLQPFGAVLKADVDSTGVGSDERSSVDNQLASVFFRWVLPRSGAELYGEYARDDHSWDLRDFFMVPDHRRGFVLGARKVWASERALLSLRGEVLDAQVSHVHRVRRQEPLYTHGTTLQGHTLRGQILGSPAAYAGGGSVVALERYTPAGRWAVDWTRTRLAGPHLRPDSIPAGVVHSLGAEATLFRAGLDLSAGVRGSWALDRPPGGDAFNLSAALGVRVGLRGAARD